VAVNKRVDILLVEDNLGDVKLITDALAETDLHPSFHNVRDGIEAIQFLRKQPPFEDAPKPAIIMVDLNLPRKDGRAVLAEIKSDPALAPTPVIILSGSDAPQDIAACYALHANCYIIKPRDLFGMNETICSLVGFWLQKVKLPPDANSLIGGGADK
jgi:chemotaxis family two-component system response regulator Rcp1